jgi:adhesin/invasin
VNPYTGQAATGVTVNFSDGGKGGSFNPPSAVTGSYGEVSTVYTVPPKVGTYTLTISGTGFGNATATATAIAGGAIKLVNYSGAKQTGAAGSTLAKAITVQAQDAAKNGVPGVTVTFTANNGGIVSSSSVITGPTGLASTMLQLPTTVSTVTVTAASSASGGCSGTASACKMTYAEYSVAGPAASVAPTSGNNQVATAGTQLPQVLTVLVTNQYGNPVAGNSVTFSDGGAGGTFSNPNPGVTGTNGTVSQYYTLPATAGGVTITATASGVTNPAAFNETGQ